jgi:hypothetical protein
MDIQAIFGLQFVFSVIVYALIARWFVSPWLANREIGVALVILVLPHMFRHVGLSFLVPNLNAGPLPETFAPAAAYGDLLSAVLAIAAIIALRSGLRIRYAIVWIFNIFGTADLLNALRQADALQYFGATWFIPTMLVPLLLVSHFLIFAALINRTGRQSRKQQSELR